VSYETFFGFGDSRGDDGGFGGVGAKLLLL
jgi:hypothetical protein